MAPRLPKNPPAPVGHNSAAAEEAERVQMISFIGRLTTTGNEVGKAKGPYDAAKKAHNSVFALARSANPEWTRKYLEKKMEEMARSASENARLKAMEARHDRWLGITSPEQQKMHLDGNTPQESRDESDWGGRGYSTGLRGLAAELPEGIPARMDQSWLRGHEKGYAEYKAALLANVPGGKSISEQAKADFREDNPQVNLPEDDSEAVV